MFLWCDYIMCVCSLVSHVGRIRREGLKHKRDFGLSLVLSNVPMSPKFINGSFAALFDDNNDILTEYLKYLQSRDGTLNHQPIR